MKPLLLVIYNIRIYLLTFNNLFVRPSDTSQVSCVIDLGEVIISEPSLLTVNLTLLKGASCDSGATVEVAAIGGEPSYLYSIDKGTTWQSSSTFLDVAPGEHNVYVRDINDCMVIDTMFIDSPVEIAYNVNPTLCFDGANGELLVTVVQGVGNYRFILNDTVIGVPTPINSNTYTFKNLTPGEYTVAVEDELGCTSVKTTHLISSKLEFTTEIVKSSGPNDGEIVVNGSGGKPPYLYSIDNGVTFISSHVFVNLLEGSYTVIIRDSNNCMNIGVVIINSQSSDADGHEVPDSIDTDDDNDGISDLLEERFDTDGDGIPDSLDLDSDNDGILDVDEGGNGYLDTNGDGVIDSNDTGYSDVDRDGQDDVSKYILEPDTDADGILDYLDLDSDNDGINDVIEDGNIDINNDGIADGGDTDGDGIVDSVDGDNFGFGEGNGGEPDNTDTDGDGVSDYNDLDSDDDGINDIEEGGNDDLDGNGLVDGPDSDGDGILDEVDEEGLVFGDTGDSDVNDTDPTDPYSGGTGVVVDSGIDSDGDGIADSVDGLDGFGDKNTNAPNAIQVFLEYVIQEVIR